MSLPEPSSVDPSPIVAAREISEKGIEFKRFKLGIYTAFFAALPMIPILLMIVVGATVFQRELIDARLEIVTAITEADRNVSARAIGPVVYRCWTARSIFRPSPQSASWR